MSPGLAVFIASDALGAGGAAASCYRTSRDRGRRDAVREGVVLGLSLSAYTGVCLWLGYGLWPQLLASLAGAVFLAAGWQWIPSAAEFIKGDR